MEITLKVTSPAASAFEILRHLGSQSYYFCVDSSKESILSCEDDQVADLTIGSVWTFQMTVFPPSFCDIVITVKKISCVLACMGSWYSCLFHL